MHLENLEEEGMLSFDQFGEESTNWHTSAQYNMFLVCIYGGVALNVEMSVVHLWYAYPNENSSHRMIT